MSLRIRSDINIRQLPGKVMLKLRDDLDTAPESQNWRALVALLKEPYNFSQTETEKFALQIYSNSSPANQLILELGGKGMRVDELVWYLDQLRLERILTEFKNYERIRITTQPVEVLKLYVGECLKLSVEASGFPYPRYQWFHAQTQIDGATENTLKIDNIRQEQAGMYCCRLHNSGDTKQTMFSSYSTVNVYPQPYKSDYMRPVGKRSYPPLQKVPSDEENTEKSNLPVITSHPREIFIFLGHTFYLTCEAKGRSPLSYTWYRDNKFFAESEIPVFQVNNATPQHSGRYVCKVHNSFGEAFSIPAVVTVAIDDHPSLQPVPHITTQPSNSEVDYNGVTLFTCEAVGSQPICYQWFQDNIPLPGATNSQLELRNVMHDAVYQCQVSNPSGCVFSRKALLRVGSAKDIYQSGYTATDKVALLIGNYNYRCENTLKAPQSDIQILADIFSSLNYKVVSLLNLTLTEMKAAVAEFCDLIGDGVYCVFYFCGHGFEENGQCYFVPEDAQHDFSEKDCLCAEEVLAKMQRKKPRNCTMILDICRKRNKNGPPQGEMSCVEFDVSQGNCCICYATCVRMAAYEIGDSGILVKHLQNPLRQPIKIEEVFARMREGIGKDPLVKGKQIAEMRTFMQEQRSFCDPIDYHNGWTQEFNRRRLAWESARRIPDPITIQKCPQLGIVLELEFQASFSNVLQVYVSVKEKGITEECTAWIACMPSSVSVSESPSIVSEGKTKNSIQDIQKLKDDLIVNLSLRYRLKGSQKSEEKTLERISLGMPLVAPLKLWQKKSSMREPTEQMEEEDGTTSYGYK